MKPEGGPRPKMTEAEMNYQLFKRLREKKQPEDQEVGSRKLLIRGALLLALAGGAYSLWNNDSSDKDSKTSSQKTSNPPKKPSTTEKISINPNDPDGPVVTFNPIPGVYGSIQPEKTCEGIDPVEFSRESLLKKFARVVVQCKGNLRSNGQTDLKCTVPGYKANADLFRELQRIFLETGIVDSNTQKFGKRTFVFHREDGKDGVPMQPVSNFSAPFTAQAKTQAQPHLSHSFTNIPISGDKVDDIGGLATEICQTLVIPKYQKEIYKSEIICNSYNLAVRGAYTGMSYGKYASLARGTAIMLKEGGKRLQFRVLEEQFYINLQKALANKPDILVPAK